MKRIKHGFRFLICLMFLTALSLLMLTSCTKDFEGISFEGDSFLYDGEVKSLKVTGDLPEGAVVTYENNDKIEEGSYVVTATITKEGYNTLILSATMVITREEHTVTFKQPGESDVVRKVLHLDSLLDVPAPVQKNGYLITWESKDLTCVSEDMIVNAVIIPIEYKINYVITNGKNNPQNPTKYTIESETITLCAPTSEEGLLFCGFYKSPDYDSESRVYEIPRGSMGDVTLYCEFGSVDIESAPGFTLEEVDIPTLAITFPSSKTSVDLTNLIITPSRTSWQVFADEECKELLTNNIMPLDIGDNTAYLLISHASGDYTKLYRISVYRPREISYSFHDGSKELFFGKVSENQPVNPPEAPDKKGYKFLGWTLGDSEEVVIFPYVVKSTDEDVVFKAKYSLCVYDINYMLFGGENNSNNPLSYTVEDERELFIPTRKGYRFDGWFLDENFNTQIMRISGGTGNITLYAKWTLEKYNIIYELFGGDNDPNNPLTYDINTTRLDLFMPTRKGFTFGGWYIDSGFVIKFTSIAAGTTGDLYLYAKWIPNKNTVIFDGNGSTSGSMDSITAYTDEIIRLPENLFKKEGYTFLGWTLDKDSDTYFKDMSDFTVGADEEIVLYAVWEAGSEGLIFELTPDGKYTVVGYRGTDKEVIIPRKYKDTDVVSVSDRAFEGNTNLGKIVIPYGIKTIGVSAFSGCTSLSEVVISYSVEHVMENAFSNCNYISTVKYTGSEYRWGQIRFDSGNRTITDLAVEFNAEDPTSTDKDDGIFTPPHEW